MSGLYKNVIQFDWNVANGEYAAFVNSPFGELALDPVFRVLSVDMSAFTADIEVVQSTFLTAGTQYLSQPLAGLRRVKLSTISDQLTYLK